MTEKRLNCPYCGSEGEKCENPACGRDIDNFNFELPVIVNKKLSKFDEFDKERASLLEEKTKIDTERVQIAQQINTYRYRKSSNVAKELKIRDNVLCGELTVVSNKLAALKSKRQSVSKESKLLKKKDEND